MRQRTILTSILAAALIAAPGAVAAQDDFDDDFEEDFDDGGGDDFDDDFGDDFDDSGSDGGGGDAAMTSGDDGSSGGSGEARGLGVGAIAPLANVAGGSPFGAGPAVTYDIGNLHFDGILAFADNDAATTFGLAARGWYHLMQSEDSDFSLGGGLAFANISPDGADDSTTPIFIDLGAEIRMFLVEQVALRAATGFVVGVGDADGFQLGGQVLGGITYFFE